MVVGFHTGGIEGIDRAVAEVESLARTLDSVGDGAGLARASRLAMLLHGTGGHYERASEAAEQLIDVAARSGETRLVGTGIVNYAVCALRGPTEAGEALARCLELIERIRDDRRAEAVVLGIVGVLHAMVGHPAEAREASARSRANLIDLGMSISAVSTANESSRVLLLDGNALAAEQDLRSAHDTVAEMGETYLRSSLAGSLAHVLWILGRHDESDHFASIAEEFADADDVDSQVVWRTIRAKLLAERGRADEAVEMAASAVAKSAETDDIDQQADTYRDLAEVYALIGDEQAEGPAVQQALQRYERKGDVVQTARMRARLVNASPA